MSYTPTSNERTWEKFDADGNARLHRGSTIVSRLNADCDVYRAGQRIQEDLKQTELRDHFALTPPNSFHMTVLEGLKDRSLLGKRRSGRSGSLLRISPRRFSSFASGLSMPTFPQRLSYVCAFPG